MLKRDKITFSEFNETIEEAISIVLGIYEKNYREMYPILKEYAINAIQYEDRTSDIQNSLAPIYRMEFQLKRVYGKILETLDNDNYIPVVSIYNNDLMQEEHTSLDKLITPNYDEFYIARDLSNLFKEIDGIRVRRLKKGISMHILRNVKPDSEYLIIEPREEQSDYQLGMEYEYDYDIHISKEPIVIKEVFDSKLPVVSDDYIDVIAYQTKWNKLFYQIKEKVEEYKEYINNPDIQEKLKLTNTMLFNSSKMVNDFFKNKDILNKCDLSNINFDDKNISGLDISGNIGNLTINFDKIKKDLSNSVIRGYNLSGTILSNFNLTDADVTKTYAGIDILSCTISTPSKLSSGTQFDEDNKFYLGDNEISLEQAKQLYLNIKNKTE